MTADELVQELGRLGIVLEVRRETLHIKAPAGAMTPELRTALATHKPTLLVRGEPTSEVICLKGGLTLPLLALQLALALEDRGFQMSVDADQQFQIAPLAALTEADRVGINRWRLHLAAILGYECPRGELPQ